jgi:hypothetical protein
VTSPLDNRNGRFQAQLKPCQSDGNQKPGIFYKLLEVGDIVLARVAGAVYLHLVSALANGRVQISNNRGRVNGWTGPDRVFGIAAAQARKQI